MPNSRKPTLSTVQELLAARDDRDPDTGRWRGVLAVGEWGAPEVVESREDGQIVWHWTENGRTVRASEGLLEEFLLLAGAGIEELAKFLRKWGPLELCTVGLPMNHPNGIVGFTEGHSNGWCPMPMAGFEPDLGLWGGIAGEDVRRYSRHALTLMSADNSVRGLTRPDLDPNYMLLSEWMGAVSSRWSCEHGIPPRPYRPTAPQREWSLQDVAGELELWVRLGRVHPGATLVGDRLVPSLTVEGLFGALAAQLYSKILSLDGLAYCYGHEKFMVPDVTPRAGDRYYCKQCREMKRPSLDAKTRLRRKNSIRSRQGTPERPPL